MNTTQAAGLPRKKHPPGVTLVLLFAAIGVGTAQANQWLYTDSLQNGWQNWSSQAAVNLDNNSPVYSGSQSIAVGLDPWGYLYLHHTGFDSSPYASLSFWVNGGATGGQVLKVQGVLNTLIFQTPVWLAPLEANTWQFITIPLTDLDVANTSQLDAFSISDALGTGQPTFYLDEIQLTAVPEPSAVHLLGLGLLGQASRVWRRARARHPR